MIQIENMTYAIGDFRLQISLRVADAEYFVILGMNGSGKTILLENLCGLRTPATGRLLINQKDITRAEPRQRGMGYVPQDGALFDHLNVADNISFSLKVKGASKRECREAAGRMASLLGISHLLARPIPGLSGGERQRVALARALASKSSVLLLDEPVSALDEHTRHAVGRELRQIQRNFRLAVIHVCHSFEEARLMGDRIGIIQNGTLVQADTADALMDHPFNTWVADILRLENRFSGNASMERDAGRIKCRGVELLGPPAQGPVEFMIRSWQIELASNPPPDGSNTISGTISDINYNGPLVQLTLDEPLPIKFYVSRRELRDKSLRIGNRANITFPATAIHIF